MRLSVVSLILLFLFTSCGYRPTTEFAKSVVGDTVYLEVEIDKAEPENGIYVKDRLTEALYDRLSVRVVDSPDEADSTLYVWYTGTDSSAVKLSFKLTTHKGEYSKTVYVSTEKKDADEYIDVGRLAHRVDTLSANFASAIDEFVAYIASLR